MQQLGKYIIFLSALGLIVGVALYLFGNKLNWIGKLPGDIKMEGENFKFYAPFTTMILISIALSALLWLLKKIF